MSWLANGGEKCCTLISRKLVRFYIRSEIGLQSREIRGRPRSEREPLVIKLGET